MSLLKRGPPKQAPIAILGYPCLAIVIFVTESIISSYYKHLLACIVPCMLLPQANKVIPNIPSDRFMTIPNT